MESHDELLDYNRLYSALYNYEEKQICIEILYKGELYVRYKKLHALRHTAGILIDARKTGRFLTILYDT